MSIFFLPALISLLFKLFILGHVVLNAARVSIVFLSLIVIFAIHNSIELLGYFQFMTGEAENIFFRLYYVASVYMTLYILLHGLSVSKMEKSLVSSALIFGTTLLAGLILFTDLIVGGQYSIGYSMSAIKGPLYWIFAANLLIISSCSFIVLFLGYRRAKSHLDSVRCVHSLFALTPVILVILLGVILKIAGVNFNATGMVPIATTIFLIIVLRTESKHKLSDLRRLMPLSPERQISNNIMDLIDVYLKNEDEEFTYKDLQDGLEKEIIHYSLNKCKNNVSQTSYMMGLKNRSTLYSMMNRLDINVKALKQENK